VRLAIVDPSSNSVAYDVPLAEALARQGHEVDLYWTAFWRRVRGSGSASGPSAPVRAHDWFYRWGSTRLTAALQHPVDVIRLAWRLRRTADAVMVQWVILGRFDLWIWRLLARAIPVTFTAHNAQARDDAVDAQRFHGFSAVIAHSDGGRAAFEAAGLREVWQEPIGAYRQYAELADPSPLPLDPLRPFALAIGQVRAYKGVDDLLAAWSSVRAVLPEAELVVAGTWVDDTLPTDLPKGVRLIPRFLDEAEFGWLLRNAEVCCLPYRQIDMSGVAAAALACGTPIVATRIGGLAEYEGRGALLVDPDRLDQLAAAIIDVLQDPELRQSLQQEAARAVESVYDWDRIAARYGERLTTLTERSTTRFGH
jgi:glycosyltransferase involved in cell wall biosynthesis